METFVSPDRSTDLPNNTVNDNLPEQTHTTWPDAHGQAAMLLIESLIHGLIAKSVITVAEAIEIVDVATDVKRELAGDGGEPPFATEKSLQLLRAISSSLSFDNPHRA